jgi:hypothetical protein
MTTQARSTRSPSRGGNARQAAHPSTAQHAINPTHGRRRLAPLRLSRHFLPRQAPHDFPTKPSFTPGRLGTTTQASPRQASLGNTRLLMQSLDRSRQAPLPIAARHLSTLATQAVPQLVNASPITPRQASPVRAVLVCPSPLTTPQAIRVMAAPPIGRIRPASHRWLCKPSHHVSTPAIATQPWNP